MGLEVGQFTIIRKGESIPNDILRCDRTLTVMQDVLVLRHPNTIEFRPLRIDQDVGPSLIHVEDDATMIQPPEGVDLVNYITMQPDQRLRHALVEIASGGLSRKKMVRVSQLALAGR